MSPIYDFKCPRCGITIEQTRGYDDDTPAPTCGDCLMSLERVYSSAPGIIFKGDGWAGKS